MENGAQWRIGGTACRSDGMDAAQETNGGRTGGTNPTGGGGTIGMPEGMSG